MPPNDDGGTKHVLIAHVLAAPKEIAYLLPPARENPVKPSQRGTLTNTTQVWGVVVDKATGLVYASDMNSGLWILRRTD